MEPYAFFRGQVVPLSQAKVGIMTHALHYGTACFEGIRAYWNADHQQMYIFRMPEHYQRLSRSVRVLLMSLDCSIEECCRITLELIRRNGYREDTYIRPLVYKSTEAVGVKLHDLEHDLCIYTTPFGKYIPADAGCRCCVSSWRRVDDNSIPARAKITGSYANSALVKSEANANGFDEGIALTQDGHVSEGSGENIFLVINGQLVTPAVTDNVLEGITRKTIMELAGQDMGVRTVERQIDRSELYTCEEAFLCGTGAEITPVIEIDHRGVGTGKIGPVTDQIMKLYYDVVRGSNRKYLHWCTPVHEK